MNGRRWTALTAALLLLVQAGCSAGEAVSSAPAPTPVMSGASAPTAEPVTAAEGQYFIRMTAEEEATLSPDGAYTLLNFRSVTPEVTIPADEAAAAAINGVLQAEREAFLAPEGEAGAAPLGLAGYKAAALEDYQRRQAEGITQPVRYALGRSVSVARGDETVLSFLYDEYYYTGGAHGTTVRTGRTFLTDGRQLSFEDLSPDADALRQFCVDHILNQSRGGEFAQYSFFYDYESVIPQLAADNTWYLSRQGLVIVANPYDIAPYAFGRIEFTIPYEELSGLVHDWLLPGGDVPEGSLAGSLGGEGDASPTAQVDDGTGGAGQPILFRAQGTVQNVRLTRVEYDDATGGLAEKELLWYANSLTDGEVLRVLTWIPDAMPSLRISYRGEGGQYRAWYISQSGLDGSLILLDAADFVTLPRNITGELPFRYDLDGDGSGELLDIQSYVSDQIGSTALRIAVTEADGTVVTADSNASWDQSLWLADGDGDGRAEIYFSGDIASNDYVLQGWRYDGTAMQALEFADERGNGHWLLGQIVAIDGSRQFTIRSTRYILGTYAATRLFHIGADGVFAPVPDSQWTFGWNEFWLELRCDLPAVMDEEDVTLPAGSHILLSATDGQSWVEFLTEEHTTGRLTLSRGEAGWVVGGIGEEEAFVILPYAG